MSKFLLRVVLMTLWAIGMFSTLVVSADEAHEAETNPMRDAEHFFAQCPDRSRVTIHRDGRLLDLHAVAYTTANLMELEVLRLADWLVDLPIPGAQLRPFQRITNGIRTAYHRLGHSRPVGRFGELVDAFQLRELSLGDVATTYTVATGGTVGAGSGTVMRVQKVVDWTQHVVGDFNAFGGRLVGRRQGLVTWRLPGRAVDGSQTMVTNIFHLISGTVARTIDHTITGAESSLEVAVNLGRRKRHRDTTVFLHLPTSVYRAHELWVLHHRARIYVGTREALTRRSHAELFHPGMGRPRPLWWDDDTWLLHVNTVVMVTDVRTFATAPPGLVPYVVSAAFVFGDAPSSSSESVDNTPLLF